MRRRFDLEGFFGDKLDLLRKLHELAQGEGVKLYLVGGAPRDMVIREIHGRDLRAADLDLAAPINPFGFAKRFAQLTGGRMVVLDEEFPTARVSFRKGFFIDLSRLRAPDITGDLRLRDLTINAMAIELGELVSSGEVNLIDPTGGLEDIRRGLVRFISEDSAVSDPIRLVRLYRFAATLSFRIDPSSRAIVGRHRNLIVSAAPERIREEIFKALESEGSFPALKAMGEDGLLGEIMPEIESTRGVEQNRYHHLDVWNHTLLAYELFERSPIPDPLRPFEDRVAEYLEGRVIHGNRRISFLKLALLLHDIGKPATRTVDEEGNIHFYGHEKVGARIAAEICRRLMVGRRGVELVEHLIRHHLGLMYLGRDYPPSDRALYRFLRRTGDDWLGVVLISIPDLEASRGPLRREDEPRMTAEITSRLARLYFVEIPARKAKRRIVTGHDLIEELGLKPGPIVGELLRAIDEAQAVGEISTREEALRLARRILSKRDEPPDLPASQKRSSE